MPVKRRQSKHRALVISPRAIELYKLMDQLPERDDQWWAWHAELCREVQARPWEYPLDTDNAGDIWDRLTEAARRQDAEQAQAEAKAV